MSDERFELEDEIGAYLLGALDSDEERRMEELLDSSEGIRAHLRYMQPALELLGETVRRQDPPPQLRERILAEVGAEPARSAVAAAPSGRSWFRLPRLELRPAMGMAALALLAIVVGVGGYEVGMGGSDPRNPNRAHEIPGTPQPGSITARLERRGDTGTLELTGLDPLSPYRDYQAWVQRDGVMEPSSLFAARADGTASAAIPERLNGADAVVVTIEPRGGSKTPTGKPITSVPLPH